MYAVNAMGLLRVSAEGEMEGLDLHEHGISAYPEYVISAHAMPVLSGDCSQSEARCQDARARVANGARGWRRAAPDSA